MRDAVATMGGLLPDDVSGRDAVHVAVFSAYSDKKLVPGQDVAIEVQNYPETVDVKVTTSEIHPDKLIGIVDPFIKNIIYPGQRFWVYLYPRTITGLSHQWTHPDFEEFKTPKHTGLWMAKELGGVFNKIEIVKSEEWLRNFCEVTECPSYDRLMGRITELLDNNKLDSGYLLIDGRDAHGDIPPEFWNHVENVLGRKINKRPSYFTCSC